ncbi:hypothetical protein K3495_g10693 [Podosphaera aphanis]|nr:hypothetical protein K3495_g10693 [Podosphaera aphanis]
MSQPHQLPDAPLADKNIPKRLKTLNIQPREDEGKELLPAYSTSIDLSGYFQRKMEYDGPGLRAVDRDWNRVLVTLQGTAFRIYKPSPRSLFGNPSIDQNCPSNLIRSYNLQYAQVGVATDYVKKQYVIRIRAETEQFLLSCLKIETLVTWIQNLCAAIDLAPSLDEREYPEDLSIPRRQRYLNAPLSTRRSSSAEGRDTGNATTNTRISSRPALVPFRRSSEAGTGTPPVRPSYRRSSEAGTSMTTARPSYRRPSEPGNSGTSAPTRPSYRRSSSSNSSSRTRSIFRSTSGSRSNSSSRSNTSPQPSLNSRDSQTGSSSGPDLQAQAPQTDIQAQTNNTRVDANSSPQSRCDREGTAIGTTHPTIERNNIGIPRHYRFISRVLSNVHPDEVSDTTEDGKWRPLHCNWTALYDIAYAIRCLNVLTTHMPRKSNIVVANEEFWVVDWSTGAMSRLSGASRIQGIGLTSRVHEVDVKGLPPRYEALTQNGTEVSNQRQPLL